VLPDPWLMIQFSYRLETFALFGICGAVIAVLALLGPSRHQWLKGLLVAVAAFSIVGAANQMRTAPRSPTDLAMDIDSYVSIGVGDYGPGNLRQLSTRRPMVDLPLTRQHVKDGRVEGTIGVQPGGLIFANLMTPPQLIEVKGARVIARRALPPINANWHQRWHLVMQVDEDATPGAARIVIREAQTPPIVGGKILSMLGLIGLATNTVLIALAARRRRARAIRS
jgi:hypothetical protein